jgi:hypothetical protein
MRDWLTTPRIQVPLAATVFMVLVATVALVATVGSVSPESVPLALALVVPLAFLTNQSLFVRARTPRAAYVRAVVFPPAIALFVGPAVVTWMYVRHPDAEYSFGGPPIFDVGSAWPLFVAVGLVMLGGVVSAFLALEVFLVANTTDRSWAPVWAWCGVVLGGIAATRFMPVLGGAIGAGAAVVALLLAAHVLRRARPAETSERGPYRSSMSR